MGQREQVAADLQLAAQGVRAPRQVAHRPGQRARAVQRPLRPQQHLHPLDVVQPEVDRERNVAEVGGDAAVVVVAGRLRPGQRVGVQAAHDGDVAAARPLVDDGQARRPARQLGQVVDGAPLDVRPGHRRDAHRHLLQRLLDAGRGDDGGVLERHQPQGDGRKRHGVAGDRDVVHRGLPEAAQEHGHLVDAGGEAGERETSPGVRLRGQRAARTADQGDGGPGQRAPRRVDDDARDLSGLYRGGRRSASEDEGEDQHQRVSQRGTLQGRVTCRDPSGPSACGVEWRGLLDVRPAGRRRKAAARPARPVRASRWRSSTTAPRRRC